MFTYIISDVHFFDFTEFGEFAENVFVEIFKMMDGVHQILLGHIHPVSKGDCSRRVLVHVLEEHRL